MNFSPRADAVLNSHVQREMNALRGVWTMEIVPVPIAKTQLQSQTQTEKLMTFS